MGATIIYVKKRYHRKDFLDLRRNTIIQYLSEHITHTHTVVFAMDLSYTWPVFFNYCIAILRKPIIYARSFVIYFFSFETNEITTLYATVRKRKGSFFGHKMKEEALEKHCDYWKDE